MDSVLLPEGLGADAPHLYDEYSGIDWYEPMIYIESADSVKTTFPSGRIERDSDGLHWVDASGRWEIQRKDGQ